MSISVTQENKAFQPVTIVIDDARTLNLIRHALDIFIGTSERGEIAGYVNTIEKYSDADFALDEIKSLNQELFIICRD